MMTSVFPCGWCRTLRNVPGCGDGLPRRTSFFSPLRPPARLTDVRTLFPRPLGASYSLFAHTGAAVVPPVMGAAATGDHDPSPHGACPTAVFHPGGRWRKGGREEEEEEGGREAEGGEDIQNGVLG